LDKLKKDLLKEKDENTNTTKTKDPKNLLQMLNKHESKLRKIEDLLQDVSMEKNNIGLQVSQISCLSCGTTRRSNQSDTKLRYSPSNKNKIIKSDDISKIR